MLRTIEERNALFAENSGLIGFVMNEKLAGYWMKNENQTNYSKEDIEQVVSMGLLTACAKYDPIKFSEYKFSTYAVKIMVGEWLHWARERTTSIRFPRHVREHFSLINRESSFEKDVKEIMKDVGLSEKEVMDAVALNKNFTITSTNKLIDEDDTFGDTFDYFVRTDEDYTNVIAQDFMDKLQPRERYIVEQLLLEKGQREIAEGLGISQVQVGRIIKRRIKPFAEAHFGRVAI
ncbi:RNA polymerase sigma factor [Bacillus phage Staley]|uniref:RNA polymerase sigma factor n=1 Tax=Bacillus phage Staley TaxID=1406792 RepID=U5Q1B2_9CAUD|nr:RNA polymerase sigma factor [Bacillus phage Staley]AGY48752.1 RNA polymerase sigma factor [Bacillus phage Staley]